MLYQFCVAAKALSLHGIKQARGEKYREYFARAVLAEKWLTELIPTSNEQMWIQDSTELASQLHSILERLGIAYYITGGVASIAYGEPRTTRDLDLVVEVKQAHITRLLVATLEQAGFYCPPGAVEDIQTGRGQVLSVTHMETILNADIVLSPDNAFERSKMQRRRLESLNEAGTTQFWITSPEDLILALWRQTSQSEKQWRDVLGVLKVQGETLDFEYMKQWAKVLGVVDALAQVLVEAGL